MISSLLLSNFDGNRENNFTIIRITFAWLVLYGHSFAIHNPQYIEDPLNLIFQGSIWIGEIAVNGFFAISGYLVIASLLKRGIFNYFLARTLRIFPALIICIVLTAFILGPALTTLSLSSYFAQPETYSYLGNALLVSKIQWTLPGVFEGNILSSINGSLWSLPVEVRCYILLALLGFFKCINTPLKANITALMLILLGYYYFHSIPFIGNQDKWSEPSYFFTIGCLFYINRNVIHLNKPLALVALLAIFFTFGNNWFTYIFPICFVYLIFYITYCTKHFSKIEQLGDISYGIYIYAWPIQQIVAQVFPELGPYSNTFISTIIVLPLAYFSWQYIEKKTLTLKDKINIGKLQFIFPKKISRLSRNTIYTSTLFLFIALTWYKNPQPRISEEEGLLYLEQLSANSALEENIDNYQYLLLHDPGTEVFTAELFNLKNTPKSISNFSLYLNIENKLLLENGSQRIFGGTILNSKNRWNRLVINRYRSTNDLYNVISHNDYIEASEYKNNSTVDHEIFIISGVHKSKIDSLMYFLLSIAFLFITYDKFFIKSNCKTNKTKRPID